MQRGRLQWPFPFRQHGHCHGDPLPLWHISASDDKGETDFDGDEGLSCDAESKPQVKKVLRLLSPVSTHWNSMYDLIKRALAQKDPLIDLTKSMRSMCTSETTPLPKRPADDSANALL